MPNNTETEELVHEGVTISIYREAANLTDSASLEFQAVFIRIYMPRSHGYAQLKELSIKCAEAMKEIVAR
jgi:hypothetical protein